jgi:hypothetical protein
MSTKKRIECTMCGKALIPVLSKPGRPQGVVSSDEYGQFFLCPWCGKKNHRMSFKQLKNAKYIKCLIRKEELKKMELVDLTKRWSDAWARVGAPIEAFALVSVGPNLEGVTVWISPMLMEILDHSSVNWRHYLVEKAVKLPSRSRAALFIGDQTVSDKLWEAE